MGPKERGKKRRSQKWHTAVKKMKFDDDDNDDDDDGGKPTIMGQNN